MLARVAMGIVLRRRREDLGMTLRELSKNTSVSVGHISELERGLNEVGSELLEELCLGLGIYVEDVLMWASTEMHNDALARK